MFTARLVRSSGSLAAPSTLVRTFASTSAACSRSPSLADVTPDGLAAFDAKQKGFRQKIADLKKRKEASSSGAVTSPFSLSSAPTAQDASNASATSDFKTSSSLSTSNTDPALSATEQDEEDGKRKGKLSSLIYGTKEGREMEQEIEQSFSQVLARGKYVHSIVFHEVKPDKVDEYVELVGSWYPRMASMPENKVHLVGSWRTEVGDCDTFGMFSLSLLGLYVECILTPVSPHLGISTLSRLPRLSPLNR